MFDAWFNEERDVRMQNVVKQEWAREARRRESHGVPVQGNEGNADKPERLLSGPRLVRETRGSTLDKKTSQIQDIPWHRLHQGDRVLAKL